MKAIVPMPWHGFDAHSGAHMLRVEPSWINPFIGVGSYTLRSNPFGPHPHAGMSAVSLTLPESEGGTINRDTMDDNSLIRLGAFESVVGIDIAQSAIIFESSQAPGVSMARLQAGSQDLRGVFFSGTPIKEPMFPAGPFMGNTQDDMTAYRRAFARCEMGHFAATV